MAHFNRRRSSRRAEVDHQATSGGGRGGEGSELEVLERRWRGLGVGDAYRWRGEREAWRRSWGDGGGPRGGARGRGSGAPGSCGGVSGSGSGASGAWGRVRRGGAAGNGRAVGWSVVRGGEQERCQFWDRAPLWGESGHSGGVGGAQGDLTRCCRLFWGRGSPPLSMDLPRRGGLPVEVGVAAAAGSGTGSVGVGGVVPAGAGLGGAGLLRRGRVGRADTSLVGGGGGPWW